MKILIVTNMYPSNGDVSWRGGFVKDQVRDSLDAASKLGANVDIDVFHIKGPVSGGGLKEYMVMWPRLLIKLIFGRYDVVHSHHSFCTLMCVPWFFRLLYTVHEGELNNTSWRSRVVKFAVYISGSVIYVSHAEYLRSKNKSKHFLPCGVDLNLFTPVGNKKNYVLFPADPARSEKNASIMKNAALSSLQAGQEIEVIYGGRIPKENMPDVMSRASIVISIGKYESDGMVVKEAMACNVPVVATKAGNAAYYLRDGGGILVDADSDQVLKAIKDILKQPSFYSSGRALLESMDQGSSQVAFKLLYIYGALV